MREFANAEPETFFNESFQESASAAGSEREVHHLQARWHTEMYGYVFAAAQVGVTHRIRRDVMLYPGYEPYLGRPPSIMHYGSDYTVGSAYFNKMSHVNLQLERCSGFLFDDAQVEHLDQLSKKDALAIEHLAVMNAAVCDYYARHANCTTMPPRCRALDDGHANVFVQQLEAVRPSLFRCSDDHEGCKGWADVGECEKNPLFMHSSCPEACRSCGKPMEDIVPDDADRGNWKRAASNERKELQLRVLEFAVSAEEFELVELEEMIADRRRRLAEFALEGGAEDGIVHSEL